MHRAELESSYRVLGTAHPEVFVSELNIVRLMRQTERYGDAEAQLADTWLRADPTLGANHPIRAGLLLAMGDTDLGLNENAQAIEHYRSAREIHAQIFGETHERVTTIDAAIERLTER